MAESCGKRDIESKAGAASLADPACTLRRRAGVRGQKALAILKPV
jgi:hypothetical protein